MKSQTNPAVALAKFKAIPSHHLSNQFYRTDNPLIKELIEGIVENYFGENLLVQSDTSKQFLSNIDKLLGIEDKQQQQQ